MPNADKKLMCYETCKKKKKHKFVNDMAISMNIYIEYRVSFNVTSSNIVFSGVF